MPHTWDPERYLTYADERGRPFVELVARVAAAAPSTVVDLLRARWPEAAIQGLDSSPEMIAKAEVADPSIDFAVADLRDWSRDADPVDVLVSNATLQWVPDHLDLLPALAGRLAKSALDLNIPMWLSSPVRELIMDGDNVRGAIVEKDGKPVAVRVRGFKITFLLEEAN